MIVYLSEYIYPKVAEMLRQHATVVDNFHRIEEIDAIILWNIPVTAEMMDRAKKLKVIAKHGIGATELAAATLKKEGYLPEVDLYKLLDNLDPGADPRHDGLPLPCGSGPDGVDAGTGRLPLQLSAHVP